MSTFFISLQTEFMKIRRSAAFWLVITGGAFLPLLQMIMYLSKPSVFMKRMGHDPWMGHLLMGFQGGAFFVWPMFIILVTSLVTQIEYRNNTWKQVMASPLQIGDVYFSKFIVIQCMIITGYVLFDAWIVLSGLGTQIFQPGYNFIHSPLHLHAFLMMDIKSYIAILGMSTIQYCLSLRFKNFIGAIGTGLALIIAGLFMIPWDKVVYFPYAYSALTFMRSNISSDFTVLKHEYWSLGYFAFFLTLGFFDFSFRKERG